MSGLQVDRIEQFSLNLKVDVVAVAGYTGPNGWTNEIGFVRCVQTFPAKVLMLEYV